MSADSSKTRVYCPHCDTRLRVQTSHLGKRITCPRCHEPFVAQEETVVAIDNDDAEPDGEEEEEREEKPRRKKTKRKRNSDLREIAIYQKGIQVCLLVNLLMFVVYYFLPLPLKLPVGLPLVGLGSVASTVFVFLLAIKVYGVGLGVFFGVLTGVPCIGLIILLIVNGKATAVLKKNGISVGLLGANMSQLD